MPSESAPTDEACPPMDPSAARAARIAVIRSHIASAFRDGRRDGLADDAPLVTSGIVDSAGVLHLVEWLEERFGIRLLDDDVTPENFDSLAALADLVALRGGTS